MLSAFDQDQASLLDDERLCGKREPVKSVSPAIPLVTLHLILCPASTSKSRDELSWLSLVQISDPQNFEQINDFYFKPISFEVFHYKAMVN